LLTSSGRTGCQDRREELALLVEAPLAPFQDARLPSGIVLRELDSESEYATSILAGAMAPTTIQRGELSEKVRLRSLTTNLHVRSQIRTRCKNARRILNRDVASVSHISEFLLGRDTNSK
jgi:hypothetical protein